MTAKRRARGTGTIETTRAGQYRARFPFAADDRGEVGTFASYEDAEDALDGILAQLRADGVNPRAGRTLRQQGEATLALRAEEGFRSMKDASHIWETRILPSELAEMPLTEITRGHVRAWLASLRPLARLGKRGPRKGRPWKNTPKKLSAQTKRNALNLLRVIFEHAVEDERLAENPARGVRVKDPGRTLDGSTFLIKSEADALVRLTIESEPAVAFALYTGCRSSELRYLHWGDVSKTHVTFRFGTRGGPRKNGKVHTIRLLPGAASAIRMLKRGADHELVFPSPTGAPRQPGRVVDRAKWLAWLAACGISRRVRWHDLRHSCATLLLMGEWGVTWTYEAVKELLDHSTVKTTERYAHAIGRLADRYAEEMTRLANKPARKPAARDRRGSGIDRKVNDSNERCGWDLNPRMSVLQTDGEPNDPNDLTRLAGLSRAYVDAVASGAGDAHRLGLELAAAVEALAPTKTARSKRGRKAG